MLTWTPLAIENKLPFGLVAANHSAKVSITVWMSINVCDAIAKNIKNYESRKEKKIANKTIANRVLSALFGGRNCDFTLYVAETRDILG